MKKIFALVLMIAIFSFPAGLYAQTGWVVGDKDMILKTTNGGADWQTLTSHSQILQAEKQKFGQLSPVYFLDANNGWAIGTGGLIMKTTDGGLSWTKKTSKFNKPLYSVYSIDNNTVLAAGEKGAILRTIDGGENWTEKSNGHVYAINSFCFTSKTNGWATGYNQKIYFCGDFQACPLFTGEILKTTDGGDSWTSVFAAEDIVLKQIQMVDENYGWAVGDYDSPKKENPVKRGVVFNTVNGGAEWKLQFNQENMRFYAVFFINKSEGWVVGNKGTILKTANGGKDWVPQASGTEHWLVSIHFIDSNRGWAVGGKGTILTTNNGGSTWVSQQSNTTEGLNQVLFIKEPPEPQKGVKKKSKGNKPKLQKKSAKQQKRTVE